MITLDQLKSQLAIDHDLDDAMLQQKLDAATAWCALHIGKDLEDLDPLPATFIEAALQLASSFFENREAVAFGSTGSEVPFGVVDMLAPLRVWSF